MAASNDGGGEGAIPTAALESLSTLVSLGTDSTEIRQLYEGWANNYEADVRKWGYDLPEQGARVLRQHFSATNDDKTHVLDAGCGDGLSGVALRQVGGLEKIQITGVDLSAEMLEVAQERKCYDAIERVDLQKPLESFTADHFDAVQCLGTLTHVGPDAGTLEEFIRVTKPGGIICYSNRTDKLSAFAALEERLEKEKKWQAVAKVGPMPYLPNNPDYGDKVQVVIFVYRVPA